MELFSCTLGMRLTFRRTRFGYDLQTADRAVAVQTTVVELEFVAKIVLLRLKIMDAKHLSIEVLEARELREMSTQGARLWLRQLSKGVL
jgi:hypothetical protein